MLVHHDLFGPNQDAVFLPQSQSVAQPGVPTGLVFVDASGVSLAELRMTGAKYLSLKSARAKARTAASIGAPTDVIPDHVRPAIAAATQGDVTGLDGGLPIIFDGALLGGIGIGSGTPDQDKVVAAAALAVLTDA